MLKGQKHNSKSIQKMKLSLKGRKVWNKGLKGVQVAWNKGIKLSIEHNQKNKESHKGQKAWNKGIKMPSISGKNSHWWEGGITPLMQKIRTCFEYRQWRSDIFTKDEYTCQECAIRGVVLNADHIKPFSVIIRENNIRSLEDALACEELWNINNGRTLCVPCHKKTDTYKKKALTKLTAEF